MPMYLEALRGLADAHARTMVALQRAGASATTHRRELAIDADGYSSLQVSGLGHGARYPAATRVRPPALPDPA